MGAAHRRQRRVPASRKGRSVAANGGRLRFCVWRPGGGSMNPRRLIAIVLLCLLLVTGSVHASAMAVAPSVSKPCIGATGKPMRVLWWILENHSYDQARGHMPYLDETADACAVLADEWAITHPSLPNYLALSGGSTFGVDDDGSP